MLRETVEIVKLMWTEPDATYEGRHFSVRGAQCDPKPLQAARCRRSGSAAAASS